MLYRRNNILYTNRQLTQLSSGAVSYKHLTNNNHTEGTCSDLPYHWLLWTTWKELGQWSVQALEAPRRPRSVQSSLTSMRLGYKVPCTILQIMVFNCGMLYSIFDTITLCICFVHLCYSILNNAHCDIIMKKVIILGKCDAQQISGSIQRET